LRRNHAQSPKHQSQQKAVHTLMRKSLCGDVISLSQGKYLA
jgi:hypothetical protein